QILITLNLLLSFQNVKQFPCHDNMERHSLLPYPSQKQLQLGLLLDLDKILQMVFDLNDSITTFFHQSFVQATSFYTLIIHLHLLVRDLYVCFLACFFTPYPCICNPSTANDDSNIISDNDG